MTTDVTVVIPAYNAETTLEKAVISCIKQSYRCNIIIVVNGFGNTMEKALALQNQFGSEYISVIPPENIYLPIQDNWTKAVTYSKTEYTKLLCADDFLEYFALQEQVLFLKRNPQCALVSGSRRVVDRRGRVILKSIGGSFLQKESSFHELLRAFFLSGTNTLGEPSAVLFRTEFLLNCLPWSESFPYAIDAEMYLRMLLISQTRAGYIPKIVCNFTISASSLSLELKSAQFQDFSKLLKKYGKYSTVKLHYRLIFFLRVRFNQIGRDLIYRFKI
jgi:glycosyltransferase involved in cell wall biosynthesis